MIACWVGCYQPIMLEAYIGAPMVNDAVVRQLSAAGKGCGYRAGKTRLCSPPSGCCHQGIRKRCRGQEHGLVAENRIMILRVSLGVTWGFQGGKLGSYDHR
jgi:hypothetical protein